MSENIVLEKSYQFALRIVRLYKYLTAEKNEYVLSKQVLISGTYVGAHIKTAQDVGAKDKFTYEMQLALQQASRTEYWLKLLREGDFLAEAQFTSINADCEELKKLLTTIVKSSKKTQ
jgi:four helix bundle protein